MTEGSQPLLVRVFHTAFDLLTRPPVLTVFALLYAPLILFLGAQHQVELAQQQAAGERVVAGDFMAFYTGATLLAEGRGAELYDLEAQERLQNALAGGKLEIWQPYVNPPGLAIALMPTAALDYVAAFWFFAGAMILAGVLGAGTLVVWFRPTLARGPTEIFLVVALCLGFTPLAHTMFGGQNTVLTWALLGGAGALLHRNRQLPAGLLLGMLSYKPQFLLLIGIYLLWRRAWLAVVLTAVGGLLHYAVGAWFAGLDWPLRMLAAMEVYRPMEWAANVHTHFSLGPFFDHAVGGSLARVLTWGTSLAVLVVLWRALPRVGLEHPRFPLAWALLIAATMLTSPHLQYYDFGVMALIVTLGLHETLRSGRAIGLPLRLAIAAIYVGYTTFYQLSEPLGFQPLTLWTIAAFCWLAVLGRRPQSSR